MPHFFLPPANIVAGRFTLEPSESRHVGQVLRQKSGDKLNLFDGTGKTYQAVIDKVSPEKVEGKITGEELAPAPAVRFRLFQALPKGDKFEFVLEKMTELGASDVIPVYTERSEVRVPADKLAARLDRWNKIALAAAKQSGLARLPTVHQPMLFAQALESLKHDAPPPETLSPGERMPGGQVRGTPLTLIPWEGESARTLKRVLRDGGAPPSGINVFIGPEGGYTPEEISAAQAAGAVPVTLGNQILRTETAGIFVAAAVLYEVQD
jgi:16S rRNA (uracil1498-N3)-methyltransferase